MPIAYITYLCRVCTEQHELVNEAEKCEVLPLVGERVPNGQTLTFNFYKDTESFDTLEGLVLTSYYQRGTLRKNEDEAEQAHVIVHIVACKEFPGLELLVLPSTLEGAPYFNSVATGSFREGFAEEAKCIFFGSAKE